MISHARLLEVMVYDPVVGTFIWRIGRKKCRAGDHAGRINIGYLEIMIDGRMYLGHRLAWFYVNGVWPEGKLDHKNTIRNDNRIDNLRLATTQQNGFNRGAQANNVLGVKGVCVRPGGRFQAQISVNGRNTYIGMFGTIAEAAAAYKEKALQLHGEFVLLPKEK